MMINGRHNGNLPKALVQRFGEETIRKVCGLGDLSDNVIKRRKEKECRNLH
jgi:hypothetical protein